MRRSGGRSTVWVNGETIPEGAQPSGAPAAPRISGSGRVSAPEGEGAQRRDQRRGEPRARGRREDRDLIGEGEGAQRRDLRVGETLDRGSGEVRDVIGEGEIRIKPPPAAPTK